MQWPSDWEGATVKFAFDSKTETQEAVMLRECGQTRRASARARAEVKLNSARARAGATGTVNARTEVNTQSEPHTVMTKPMERQSDGSVKSHKEQNHRESYARGQRSVIENHQETECAYDPLRKHRYPSDMRECCDGIWAQRSTSIYIGCLQARLLLTSYKRTMARP